MRVWGVLGAMAISAIVSVIVTKKLAVHYFAIVDSYVKEICDKTNKCNEKTLATIHKLQGSFDREE